MDINDLVLNIRSVDDEVDSMRLDWESTSHWQARKKFLLHNWNKCADKDQLICLSTAWANANFMGCNYPNEIMKQIKEMENGMKDVKDLFREAEQEMMDVEDNQLQYYVPKYVNRLPLSITPMKFVRATSSEEPSPDLCSETIKRFELNVSSSDSQDGETSEDVLKVSVTCNSGSDFAVIPKVALQSQIPSSSSVDIIPSCKEKDNVNNFLKHSSTLRIACKFPSEKPDISSQKPDNSNHDLVKQKPTKCAPLKDPTSSCISPSGMKQYVGNIVDPVKDTSKLLMCLATMIKKELHMINPKNRVTAFSLVLQRLKVNPTFVCVLAKKKDVILFDNWSKNFGIRHEIKCGTWVCDLYVQTVFISQGYGKSQVAAKNIAVAGAINLLISPFIHVTQAKRASQDSLNELQNVLSTGKNVPNIPPPPALTPSRDIIEKVVKPKLPEKSPVVNTKKTLLKCFVIKETPNAPNAIVTLHESAQFSKVSIDFTYEPVLSIAEPQQRCSVVLDGLEIAFAIGSKKTEAKQLAAEKALQILKEMYPTIVKDKRGNLDEALSRNTVKGRSGEDSWNKSISNDNVGNKLLRKMGWSGSGGLGTDGKGIAAPVQINSSLSNDRTGLGAVEPQSCVTMQDARSLLKDYIMSNQTNELTFSPELSSDERKKLHLMASKHGLKSKSYGSGKNRYLVVYRHVSAEQIVSNFVASGGQNSGPH